MEELLESQITETYTPSALERKPVLDAYEARVLDRFMALNAMRGSGFNGPDRLSLREIDLYLKYYQVDDVYYFIDLMTEIDGAYLGGIKAHSKN